MGTQADGEMMSLHRAKVIQALLDSTIGELPEVRELQWDELMPFEQRTLLAARTLADGCGSIGEDRTWYLSGPDLDKSARAPIDKQKACANIRTCAGLAKNPDTFALSGIGERAPAQAAPVGF